jgi:transposase, IS5 family
MPRVWAECAYRSTATEADLAAAGYLSHIHEKAQGGSSLSEEQQQRNRERSRIRARVEHVSGFRHQSMGGKLLRTIGLARAGLKIGMMNLTYNLMRYLQLQRQGIGAPARV